MKQSVGIILSGGFLFLLALIFFTFFESCFQNNESDAADLKENVEQHYVDGKLQAEHSIQDGVKEGIGRIYYLNGKLSSECNYSKGLKNGIEKKYYSDGTLYRTREYVRGKFTGMERRFYRNGNLKTVLTYKEGMPANDLKGYYPSGRRVEDYPPFRYEFIYDRDYEEEKLLIFYVEGIEKGIRFYQGTLIEGKYFDNRKIPCGSRKGKGEIVLPPWFQGNISISVKYITSNRAPRVFEKTIQIN